MVVIGAGVVGAAVAEELSAGGWDQITVLDQGNLPAAGGSSSHAPGLVFQTNPSRTMVQLAGYTVAKLGRLGCFLPVGSLELATGTARLAELHRRQGWLAAAGVPARVLSPTECAAHHPLLDPDLIRGGLYVASDGLARSVPAVTAQLDLARGRGVRVLDRHRVLDLRTRGGRVAAVVTDRGEFGADVVVCATGIWGPRIARMVGVELPLAPLAHQFAWTGPLPALATAGGPGGAEAAHPILRHQDADLYIRDRQDRLGIGFYGHRPMLVDPDDIRPVEDADPMPSVLPFTEEDFAPGWAATQALLPATRKAKVEEGMNGLFSFTVDNMPLIGEAATVPGFWLAEAVWVTHSAGVGRAVAESLMDGYCSSFDLHGCDINRFEPHHLAPAYVRARAGQNYIEVYDIIHPLQPMEQPRPLRTTPFYPRQRELSGVFLEYAGWERPQWHEANEPLLAGRSIPAPGEWAARYWSPIVGAEALATREGVALFDMTTLKRVEVSGPGATAFLQWVTTGEVDRPIGSVTYSLLLSADGRIRSDITVARLAGDAYQVGVNGPADLAWLAGLAPADVVVRDITAGTCGLGLWGPRARDLVQPLAGDDFSNEGFGYFRARRTYLGAVPVTALRVSYVGELGWELYTTADLGLRLWDTLWRAGQPLGLVAAGRGAFTSLRLEKGYRLFGTDMTREHDPYQAGLGFAVNLGKGDFLGRAALVGSGAPDARPARLLACLTIADPADTVAGGEPVYHGGTCVGYVTSAGYGYTVGCGIAYAWLPAALAEPGQTVHIGYFDRLVPATVATEPLFDPARERLRS
ncbi:MAG: GcvT family protein [Micromonosporaceae bacterium]|nr:GcvT family protein [Micromonosporaceae bacterium]